MRERFGRLSIAAGLALFALASPWGTALAADRFVTMYASDYLPGVVTINVGDSVTWVNDDDLPHDAVGNGWSTTLLGKYDSDTVTFRRAGRFPYSCSIHPAMRSAVVVRGTAGGATVPPTDADVTATRPGPSGSPLILPLLLLTGSAVLLTLVWPYRGRPQD
jgi:plastocyanin